MFSCYHLSFAWLNVWSQACRETDNSKGPGMPCEAAFKRAADLRNHLAEHHGITEARRDVTKHFESVDGTVRDVTMVWKAD